MVNIKNMKAQAPIFIMAVAIFIILGIGIFSIFALGGYNPSSTMRSSSQVTNHGVLVSSLGLASGCVVANCGYAFGPDTVGTQTNGIQEAIKSLGPTGGIINLRAGTFLMNLPIIPAPDRFTDGKGTIILQGAGMNQTILKRNSSKSGVIIGIGLGGSDPKLSQLLVFDLTLDGNYAGWGGMFPATNQGNGALSDLLVGLAVPYYSGDSPPLNMPDYTGPFNEFDRVRFYRATGYGIQGEGATIIINSIFDKGGQSDSTPYGQNHVDNIGGGTDMIVYIYNVTFINSAGNYVDVTPQVPGHSSKVVFENSKSINQKAAGVYALSHGSIIINNHLQNLCKDQYYNRTSCGSIGYDALTSIANRGYNLVNNNTLVNTTVAPQINSTDRIFSGANSSQASIPIPTITTISSTSSIITIASSTTGANSTTIRSTTIGSTTTIYQTSPSVQAQILNPIISLINILINLTGLKPIGVLN